MDGAAVVVGVVDHRLDPHEFWGRFGGGVGDETSPDLAHVLAFRPAVLEA